MRTYKIQQFAIVDTEFTALTCPVDCSYWSIKAPADILLRSTKDDATTEDTLPANTPETFDASPTWPGKYGEGETIIYAKSSGGDVTVIGRFCL